VTERLGLAAVGPGGIAAEHARACAQHGLASALWVVGKDDESAEAFAATWGFEHATTEIDEMLADAAVDVVLIASPNPLHAEQAVSALEAGKHAIVEIPLALSLADAERVVSVAA